MVPNFCGAYEQSILLAPCPGTPGKWEGQEEGRWVSPTWEGGGRMLALEDNGQEGSEQPKELSTNTQGKDGIHTAADVRSRCQRWGQWPWA